MPHDVEFIFKIINFLSILMIVVAFILINYTEIGQEIGSKISKYLFKDIEKNKFHFPSRNGYLYNVLNCKNNENERFVVYILKKGKRKFYVYLVKGDRYPSIDLRRNRFGKYFLIKCKTEGEAESIIDDVFRK